MSLVGSRSSSSSLARPHSIAASLRPYVQIARVDHWFKNAFMLLGVVLAVFYRPELLAWNNLTPLVIAVIATCLIASSNYVLNEILDGPTDRRIRKELPADAFRSCPPVHRLRGVAAPGRRRIARGPFRELVLRVVGGSRSG